MLISTPPHDRVDAQVAASVLGIPPVDANLKARYSVPEIWLSDEDGNPLDQSAATLAQAGMHAVVVESTELQRIPQQRVVQEFSFAEQGFHVRLNGSEGALAYDRRMLVVTCTPRPTEGAPLPARTVEGKTVSDGSAFVDVYVQGKDHWSRVALYGELTDFAGLGAQRTMSQSRNLIQLVQQLRGRLRHAHFDDRLLNMQLRRRPGHGTPPQLHEKMRRGYSYATPGLGALLERISPELRDISQTELSSRLVFLTATVHALH